MLDARITSTSTPTVGHVPAQRMLGVVGDAGESRADPVARLLSDEVRQDPNPFYDELRRRGRLVRGRTALVTAHYDVCRSVLSDPGTFSSVRSLHRPTGGVSPRAVTTDPAPAEFAHHGVEALNGIDVPYAGALIGTDPPEHSRLRELVSRAFAPDAVNEMRTDVEGLADGLLDRLEGAATVDVMSEYAQALAAMIVGDVLGVPSADWPQLRQWADDLLAAGEAVTAPQRRAALASQHALRRYLDDVLASRWRLPGDALIDAMLEPGEGFGAMTDADGDAAEDSGGLSLREAGATALLILQAGYETAATLVGNGIHALGRHPQQAEILLARPELWGNAVDEVMRWNPPVALITREARWDTSLAGTVVPAGAQVVLAVGGANRDPAVFDAPHEFDIERVNAADHVGMGGGIHACVGGVLARLQAEIALRRLFERFPNVRFAAPPVRTTSVTLRGFASLPVRLGRPST